MSEIRVQPRPYFDLFFLAITGLVIVGSTSILTSDSMLDRFESGTMDASWAVALGAVFVMLNIAMRSWRLFRVHCIQSTIDTITNTITFRDTAPWPTRTVTATAAELHVAVLDAQDGLPTSLNLTIYNQISMSVGRGGLRFTKGKPKPGKAPPPPSLVTILVVSALVVVGGYFLTQVNIPLLEELSSGEPTFGLSVAMITGIILSAALVFALNTLRLKFADGAVAIVATRSHSTRIDRDFLGFEDALAWILAHVQLPLTDEEE